MKEPRSRGERDSRRAPSPHGKERAESRGSARGQRHPRGFILGNEARLGPVSPCPPPRDSPGHRGWLRAALEMDDSPPRFCTGAPCADAPTPPRPAPPPPRGLRGGETELQRDRSRSPVPLPARRGPGPPGWSREQRGRGGEHRDGDSRTEKAAAGPGTRGWGRWHRDGAGSSARTKLVCTVRVLILKI